MENMTYSQAGVNITNGNKAVDMIKHRGTVKEP